MVEWIKSCTCRTTLSVALQRLQQALENSMLHEPSMKDHSQAACWNHLNWQSLNWTALYSMNGKLPHHRLTKIACSAALKPQAASFCLCACPGRAASATAVWPSCSASWTFIAASGSSEVQLHHGGEKAEHRLLFHYRLHAKITSDKIGERAGHNLGPQPSWGLLMCTCQG